MQNPLYTEHASIYALSNKENSYNAHYERPSLKSLLPEISGRSVLDLGCGPGELVGYYLDKQCSNITAVDISPAMIDLVTNKYAAKVKCYQQDFSLGLPKENDATYDLISCSLAIHYIEKIDFLLKEIYRVLRKNGLFVFSTHHPFLDFHSSSSGDYFACEKVVETWDIAGKPFEVSFYRRPFSSMFNAVTEAGFNVVSLSEGKPAEELKSISSELYERLSTKPQFIFLKCQKA